MPAKPPIPLTRLIIGFLFVFCIILLIQQQMLLSQQAEYDCYQHDSESSFHSANPLMRLRGGRDPLQSVLEGMLHSIPNRFIANVKLDLVTNTTILKPTIVKNLIPRPNTMETKEDVIVATHITTNKLPILLTHLDHWGGPASVAVYIQSQHHIQEFFSFYRASIHLLQNVSFHFVLEKTDLAYPHNILRNVAIETVECDYFLAIDVDFIPMPKGKCHSHLQNLIRDKSSGFTSDRQRLFVLPAFSLLQNKTETSLQRPASPNRLPMTRNQLVEKLEEQEMIPFRYNFWFGGHFATNYPWWLRNLKRRNTKPFYNLEMDESIRYYEPYVVGYRPGIPRYWEDFRGYGLNKISFLTECVKAGYSFAVLNKLYVVHLDHPTYSLAKQGVMKNASRLVYTKFMEYNEEKYGDIYKEIFLLRDQFACNWSVGKLILCISKLEVEGTTDQSEKNGNYQKRKPLSSLFAFVCLYLDAATVMLLKTRLSFSFLFILALVNLGPQWKKFTNLQLSINSDADKFTITLTTTPFNTGAVKAMDSSADMQSLTSFHKTQINGGDYAPTATASRTLMTPTTKISNAANATTVEGTSLPVSVEAIDSSSPLTVFPLPSNPQVYFVHVGKAGGLTMNLILDTEGKWKAIDCFIEQSERLGESYTTFPSTCYVPSVGFPSQLSQHMVSHLHLAGFRFNRTHREWILNHTDTFLYTVRDPVHRLVSAYNFHRYNFRNTTKASRKLFYEECFPNGMEDLARQLLLSGKKDDATCQSMGILALQGGGKSRKSGSGNHFEYNYGYYASRTIAKKPNHSVAVIRTEYMWDDIYALEKELGGTGSDAFSTQAGTKVSHGSEKWVVGEQYSASSLSPENLHFLCCILYKELEVYQRLILLAANLNQIQKRDTMAFTLTRCQIDYAGDPVSQPFPWFDYHKTTCRPIIQQVVLPGVKV
ncbi:unnamed protein product [Cylindrotheca closterium]|uniref:Uncharacterized protein n=1 Tax=Cylindrotheca closterium TaxID=2856 RepID=A0AAD2FMR6_9STRA|nr:unnamed protein product [Cylindrotheca closterium]